MTGLDLFLIGFASILGGMVNALAGGGTLITFPMLTAIGIPPVEANVTNTVSLCPGYAVGASAQFKDLDGNKKRLALVSLAGTLGGLVGGVLLLNTGERMFRAAIPFMILFAVGLLAVEEPLCKWRSRKTGSGEIPQMHEAWTFFGVFLASVYGGYFAGGLGIIVLAVLASTLHDSLTRLNALKQTISFWVGSAAAVFFLFSDKIVWSAALVMAVGSSIGGAIGGLLAGRIRPQALRWTVMVVGIIIAIIYFVY